MLRPSISILLRVGGQYATSIVYADVRNYFLMAVSHFNTGHGAKHKKAKKPASQKMKLAVLTSFLAPVGSSSTAAEEKETPEESLYRFASMGDLEVSLKVRSINTSEIQQTPFHVCPTTTTQYPHCTASFNACSIVRYIPLRRRLPCRLLQGVTKAIREIKMIRLGDTEPIHVRMPKVLNQRDTDEVSVMEYAVSCANTTSGTAVVTRLLKEEGVVLEDKDDYGWTPLLWAAYCGKCDVLLKLIEAGADILAEDDFGRGLFHHLALYPDTIKYLKDLVRGYVDKWKVANAAANGGRRGAQTTTQRAAGKVRGIVLKIPWYVCLYACTCISALQSRPIPPPIRDAFLSP